MMKTFYPPNYDKVNGHMEKLPKIQRFNEEYETYSVASSKLNAKMEGGKQMNGNEDYYAMEQ